MGGGIVKKLGIGAALSEVGKSKVFKILEPVAGVIEVAKRKGENVWDAFSHIFNTVTTKIGDKFVTVIKLTDGKLLKPETSEKILEIGKHWDDGARISNRTVTGIELKAIPDELPYVNTLADYSKKALRQGFEPFQSGIHKLQKVYKRNGIRARVGEEFVENTA